MNSDPLQAARLQRKLDRTTVVGGLAATALALLAGFLTRNADWSPPVWLLIVLALLVLWHLLSLFARLMLVRSKGSSLAAPPAFWRWLGSRLAIYFAAPILLFCWLVSLPVGSPWVGITGRALFLLLGLNFLVGLIG